MVIKNMDKTIKDLLLAYAKGQRYFKNWYIEDESLLLEGLELSNTCFENCFLFISFKKTKLYKVDFINCNLKEADFTEADFNHSKIKNCSIESAIFKGAKIDNLVFEENYYFGLSLGQADFKKMMDHQNKK